jgi:hypothetical protein
MDDHELQPRTIGPLPAEQLTLLGPYIRAAREKLASVPEPSPPLCPSCHWPMHGGRGGFPWTCFGGCSPVKQEQSTACGDAYGELAEQVRGHVASWCNRLISISGWTPRGIEDYLRKHVESQRGVERGIHNDGTVDMYLRAVHEQCKILREHFGS